MTLNEIEMRDAFFEELSKLASVDERVVFLTADHGAQALSSFEQNFPDRFYNIGIAEQNMISVAAGLAAKGKIPVAYGIAPFVSLRALEQVTLDVASMNLPVTIVGIGPGFCYSTDGYTHHGHQDLPAMATVPNLTIKNSSDPETTRLFASEIGRAESPSYIRIEKGPLPVLTRESDSWFNDGFGVVKKGDPNLLVISTGSIVHEVLTACEALKKKTGLAPTVVDLHLLKPMPLKGLVTYLTNADHVFVVEENYSYLAKEIALAVVAKGLPLKFSSLSVPEKFFSQGAERAFMRNLAQISADQILNWITNVLRSRND
jgi:transketolase